MARYLVAQTDAEWFPISEEEMHMLSAAGAEVRSAECRSEEDVIALAQDADAILCSRAPITERVIAGLRRCRIISRYGIGLDNIDVAAATRYGVVVAHVPDFCVQEVATHEMALLLACARRLPAFIAVAHGCNWNADRYPGVSRLQGRVFGAAGFGRIGRMAVDMARGLGMRTLAHDPNVERAEFERLGVESATWEELLSRSDYLALHMPLLPETRHLVDEAALRRMKPTAYLINCARGRIVDEQALVRALSEGWIAGAALDVLEEEPAARGNPLLQMPNVIVTPHCAAFSEESFRDLRVRAADAIVRMLRGDMPRHIANPEVRAQAGCEYAP